MKRPAGVSAVVALAVLVLSGTAAAQVIELQGAWLIDGYTFQPGDRSPRGTIAYDPEANAFNGTYVGLKLPADRPELHAWFYNTQTRQIRHLGRIDYKVGTIGKDKGAFKLALPADIKGAKFTGWELVAFSAEVAGGSPTAPSGSKIQLAQRPAFYLYAPLPGAGIPSVYCGHGQDFSYTSDPGHTCFD